MSHHFVCPEGDHSLLHYADHGGKQSSTPIPIVASHGRRCQISAIAFATYVHLKLPRVPKGTFKVPILPGYREGTKITFPTAEGVDITFELVEKPSEFRRSGKSSYARGLQVKRAARTKLSLGTCPIFLSMFFAVDVSELCPS